MTTAGLPHCVWGMCASHTINHKLSSPLPPFLKREQGVLPLLWSFDTGPKSKARVRLGLGKTVARVRVRSQLLQTEADGSSLNQYFLLLSFHLSKQKP